MGLGYACVNETLKPEKFRDIRLKTIQTQGIKKLKEVVMHNFELLEKILKWNINHGIYFYRMPTGVIPLATHPEIMSQWSYRDDEEIVDKIAAIAFMIKIYQIRLSIHPDQYHVINSNKIDVVKKSIESLNFYGQLMKDLGGSDLILHVGGVYGDKTVAMNRFIDNYHELSGDVKEIFRLENDDKSYSVYEVLEIAKAVQCSVVLDVHHHRCLSEKPLTQKMIDEVMNTWRSKPKIHLSSGKTHERDKKHHDFILEEDVLWVYGLLKDRNVDIMIEAKKKELALLEMRKIYETKIINQ